jgi:hypothetical protein
VLDGLEIASILREITGLLVHGQRHGMLKVA